MTLLKNQIFVCIDCEATGLDPASCRVIEVAAATFSISSGVIETFETLINPCCLIPEESFSIHHISDDMVKDQPKIQEIFPQLFKIIGNHPLVGHGIGFDVDIIHCEANRFQYQNTLKNNLSFDTLRLARLYGESPSNSLEVLRKHFNIEAEGAHRAMNDVIVNIQVFKQLASRFKTVKELIDALEKPIFMKNMPLGKHKGRPMKEIPLDYLLWAARQDFDKDLLFSLRSEVNRRKKGDSFVQSSNPFANI